MVKATTDVCFVDWRMIVFLVLPLRTQELQCGEDLRELAQANLHSTGIGLAERFAERSVRPRSFLYYKKSCTFLSYGNP